MSVDFMDGFKLWQLACRVHVMFVILTDLDADISLVMGIHSFVASITTRTILGIDELSLNLANAFLNEFDIPRTNRRYTIPNKLKLVHGLVKMQWFYLYAPKFIVRA
ncbi:unnamed protein product [Ranitomeya imitator]|uniref:Uncharacterized protein n=1 Tax=Ranitomeya imitator TaxID=111125 RepID=A0ABN9M630_9NEOB|nr:unnamed protein product [Ranitomeya imitator]